MTRELARTPSAERRDERGDRAGRRRGRRALAAAGSSSRLVAARRRSRTLLLGAAWSAASSPAAVVLVALVARWRWRCRVVARRWLLRALRAARVRRAWWRAWTDCELPRVRAGRVSAIPAGELVRVRASRGSSLEAVEQRAEELAVCLQVREVRVARDPDNAATGTVTLVRRDPLAGMVSVPWPHRDASRLSLWEPIPVGVDELGETVTVSLPERNVLMGGEPGAGKSAALSLLVATAALDPSARLWLLDGKLVELSVWAPCAQRLAGPDIDEAIALLRELREEMEARYRELLARGKRKIARDDGLPLHLVACDELAFYLGCRGPQEAARVRRAAARPGRPRPRGRRDRVRRDAEAGLRRRAVGAARPVRVPAGAALQHAAGLGHDPRPGLGDARALGRDDRARAARRRAAARRGRHAGPAARLPPDRRRRRRARHARSRAARRRLAGGGMTRSRASLGARERLQAARRRPVDHRGRERLDVARSTVGKWLRGVGERCLRRECELCGEPFLTQTARRRFCTPQHAEKHRRIYGPPHAARGLPCAGARAGGRARRAARAGRRHDRRLGAARTSASAARARGADGRRDRDPARAPGLARRSAGCDTR